MLPHMGQKFHVPAVRGGILYKTLWLVVRDSLGWASWDLELMQTSCSVTFVTPGREATTESGYT